jgi:RNase P/RNase MRP subunit POP5
MVRHKTRWLLVLVDFNEDVMYGCENKPSQKACGVCVFGRKELSMAIRDGAFTCWGDSVHVYTNDIQVRFYDAAQTRLALVRVPHQFCNQIRASLTFVSTVAFERVVLSTIAIAGSARAAKAAVVRFLRAKWQTAISERKPGPSELNEDNLNTICKQLTNILFQIQTIDR